jgi:hypothetical protein
MRDEVDFRGEEATGLTDELRRALQKLIDAALTWNSRDYGDAAEINADAGLSDAVRTLQQAAEREGLSPSDVLVGRRGS